MSQPTKGTKQFGGEIAADLADRWREFCAGRKERYGRETARYHLEIALRRHMANPPDPLPDVPPLPPLPPAAPAAPPKRRGRPPKPKKGSHQ